MVQVSGILGQLIDTNVNDIDFDYYHSHLSITFNLTLNESIIPLTQRTIITKINILSMSLEVTRFMVQLNF